MMASVLSYPTTIALGRQSGIASRRQQRSISLLWNKIVVASSQRQDDLDHAVELVRSHDPAGFLPGRLLPTPEMQTAYFAIRSFWVETGLRFGSTARVPPNATPREHLEWWQQSLDDIYRDIQQQEDEEEEDQEKEEQVEPTRDRDQPWQSHPTLRLLHSVIQNSAKTRQSTSAPPLLSKIHFDDVLQGRRNDLDLKQYPTLQHLEDHAALSCGSLTQLVLESSGKMTPESHPMAHQAARLVGKGHGLANALRTSIPVISTTGKLIIPQDLCEKYGITSPRYLLSALGQGDTQAQDRMARAVQDIAEHAQAQLQAARDLRDEVLAEDPQAVAVLLPALASETFLQRLRESQYNLTDRNLRNVGWWEHAQCASRMILAYYQQRY